MMSQLNNKESNQMMLIGDMVTSKEFFLKRMKMEISAAFEAHCGLEYLFIKGNLFIVSLSSWHCILNSLCLFLVWTKDLSLCSCVLHYEDSVSQELSLAHLSLSG